MTLLQNCLSFCSYLEKNIIKYLLYQINFVFLQKKICRKIKYFLKKLLSVWINIVGAVILSYCGSSKTTTSKKVKVEQNECEVLALEAPEKRAYGTASSHKLQFAKDQAAVYARMELSRIVAAGVKAGSKVYDQQYENQTAIENKGKVEQLGMVIAENELKNSRIVCSNAYEIPDRNLYEAHVCVEMPGNIADKIAEKISEDEKLRIDFDEARFKKEFEAELAKYKKENQ